MPRLRTRMISRRGSSRGRVSRQPSSTTSEPSSEASDFRFERYPETRSGRGRGQGQIFSEERSLHPNSHTVRFRFPCTLGNSSFIASVTVELSEASTGLEADSPGHPSVPRMEDQMDTTQNVNTQRNTQGGSATQGATFQAGPSAPSSGGPSGKEGRPSKCEDPNQFGCRIVEESPPTSHED